MPQVVYLLCGLTSLACAMLLGRAYRRSGVRLLFWSTLCFVGLTVTNMLLFVDMILLPNLDLRPIRNLAALLGLTALLYGLIFEEK